jgi:hypothetical protein
MGSTSFFSKLASYDPLAQALDLPGAHKYQDSLGIRVGPDQGPYTGVQATLAGANSGYAANGPGANGNPAAPAVNGAAGWGHPAVGVAPAVGVIGGGQQPMTPVGGVPNYRGNSTVTSGGGW